jgi:dienelactone hydrolase
MSKHNVTLPTPTGMFGIGKTTYHVIDTTRREKYSTDPAHPHREFTVQLWYPAAVAAQAVYADYISPASRAHIATMRAQGRRLPGLIEADVQTHAYLNVPVSSSTQRFPVILFSHGFGVPHYAYTSLFEELASQGYVVATADHTYKAEPSELPQGKVVGLAAEWAERLANMEKFEAAADQELQEWVVDLQFILDEVGRINQNDTHHLLTQRLDLNRVGAFGHSFGGTAVTHFGKIDHRCSAVANIDGCLFSAETLQGFEKPYMLLLAGAHELSEREHNRFGGKQGFDSFLQRHRERIKEFYDNLTHSKYHISLKDANHMSFSDIALFSSEKNQAQFVHLTRQLLVTFFNMHLKQPMHNSVGEH